MTEIDTPEAEFPTEEARRMWRKSGGASDARRLVQFLFLLMRDELPSTAIVEAHQHANAYAHDLIRLGDARMRVEQSTVIDSACERLQEVPTPRLFLFIDHLVANYDRPDGWNRVSAVRRTLHRIPQKDDVVCRFSNGWLARHAQYVVDDLERTD